jgi:hypothetical protein
MLELFLVPGLWRGSEVTPAGAAGLQTRRGLRCPADRVTGIVFCVSGGPPPAKKGYL